MSHPAAETFRQAAKLNAMDPWRDGNVVNLPGDREAIVAGDLHGNRAGLAKIVAYADLDRFSCRCLVLQELIHGPPDERAGQDRSVEVLLRAARLRIVHPQQVLFVLTNHDVAQMTGGEVMKDGREQCRQFDAGVRFAFGDGAEEVRAAVGEFLRSMPLAVRCDNGTLISHSLPSPRRAPAGLEVLVRPYRPEDLARGGAVYEWTWGRGHTEEHLEALAGLLGVKFFVLGHQPTEMGYELLGQRAIIIASDHEHGCVLHLPADAQPTAENAESFTRPLAAMRV